MTTRRKLSWNGQKQAHKRTQKNLCHWDVCQRPPLWNLHRPSLYQFFCHTHVQMLQAWAKETCLKISTTTVQSAIKLLHKILLKFENKVAHQKVWDITDMFINEEGFNDIFVKLILKLEGILSPFLLRAIWRGHHSTYFSTYTSTQD